MQNSKIQWTTHTFNPWIGCTKISPACDHCYAESMARRMGVKWGPDAERRLSSDAAWSQPYVWDRAAERSETRARVFCASMGDIFEGRADQAEARGRLFETIQDTQWLDWLLLTKRPNNIMRLVPESWRGALPGNVWVGATCETQEWLDKRMLHLAQVPAAVRFISAEPLLGPIDITAYAAQLHWVIGGGESSAIGRARRTQEDWARSLRDQCIAGSIPFFWKQWGHQMQTPSGVVMLAPRTKKNPNRQLDGQEWNQFPAPGFEAPKLGDRAHRARLAAARKSLADLAVVRDVMTT